jgi:hypothetical protein
VALCDGVGGELSALVMYFKLARLLHPMKVVGLAPTVATVDSLVLYTATWLSRKGDDVADNADRIVALKRELPAYLTACSRISPDSDLDGAECWKSEAMAEKDTKFPAWAELTREVCLLQPSSAAAERVFSIMRRTFDAGQQTALDDYVETSLMMQYNKMSV